MKHTLNRLATLVGQNQQLVTLGLMFLVAGSVALAPTHLYAQMPNFNTVDTGVKNTFVPLVHFIRYAAAFAAAAMALKELFGAVQGNDVKKYGAFFGLIVVCGILVAPSSFFDIFGMHTQYSILSQYGL